MYILWVKTVFDLPQLTKYVLLNFNGSYFYPMK